MLEDVLADDLLVVFCGTNSGEKPAKIEAYYAGRGNKFWSVLATTRITPRQFRPEESSMLLAHDIGLADLVRTRSTKDSSPEDADYDVPGFRKRIAEHHPRILAFNGKEAAKRALNKDTVRFGRQKETLEKAVVHVLPSTSDLARDTWDESYWLALAEEVRKMRRGK